MKTKTLVMSLFFSAILTENTFGQGGGLGNLRGPFPAPLGWTGGTNPGPLDIRNNFGGQPINFFTGGAQRMIINGSGGATAGFVGMGTTTPNRILQIHDGVDAQLQITNTSTGLAAGNGMLVGLFNNSNSAFIANQQNDALYFSTNGAAPGTVKMSILANGNTGIGVGFLNPLHLVDVRNGNINIGQGTGANVAGSPQAYMIGGNNILWHNGEVRNLFVGVAAGANTTSALAFENTFIGSRAGFANTTGQRNTFMGANAGENATTGNFNTFIGTEAGRFFTTGNHNTFVGEQAGDRQLSGTNNSFFGAHTVTGPFVANGIGSDNTILGAFAGADIINGNGNTLSGVNAGGNCTSGSFNTLTGTASGSQCTSGLRNTMSGWASGLFTTTGNDNVFMGQRAGFFNSTGSNNTYVGANTGNPFIGVGNTATNSTAIGNGAQIRRSDVMILGNNAVNVGIGLSNDFTPAQGPQNRLEIDAGVNGLNPSPSGAAGTSGLRFRDLHSGNTPITNPSTSVLSVNALGDVILVPANAGGSALGNICNTNTNPLASDWEIPLNNHNFLFGGQGTSNYNVGIGTTCAPAAKLDILETSGSNATTALNVINTDLYGIGINVVAKKGPFGVYSVASLADPVTLRTVGVYGEANDVNAIKGNFGIYGVARNNVSQDNIGGFFDATSPVLNNTGMRAYANNASLSNVAGQFQSISSVSGPFATISNIGVSTLAFGPNPIANIALYAQVDINRPQDYAGYFDGDVYVNGPTSGTGYLMASDAMFKTNVDTISDAINIINLLKPKQFYYDTTNAYGLNFSSKKQYGLIAQDVETIMPELVGKAHQNAQKDTAGNVITQATDYKTVNYNALFGIMLKGMQEQQAQIKKQDSLIAALSNQINSCCSNTTSARQSNSTINQLDIELSDKDVIVLNQNVPNPFAEQTTITYNVPASVGKAQLIFFNINGQVIQTVDIKTRGKGKVNVFASDLSSGLYNYTLVADGKVIDSKKMVRE